MSMVIKSPMVVFISNMAVLTMMASLNQLSSIQNTETSATSHSVSSPCGEVNTKVVTVYIPLMFRIQFYISIEQVKT